MLEKLIYSRTKRAFNKELDNNNVHEDAIAFIEDTKEIYTHGNYFDGTAITKNSLLENDNNYAIDGKIPSENGVYIYSQDTFIEPSEFNGTEGMVAIIDNNSVFLLDAKADTNYYNGNTAPWGKVGESYLINYKTKESALTDFDGFNNLKHNYIWGSLVSKMTAGGYGSIASVGQWQIIINHLSDINNAIQKLNGTLFTTGEVYWTSTEYDSQKAWSCTIGATEPFISADKGFSGTSDSATNLYKIRTIYNIEDNRSISLRLYNLEKEQNILNYVATNTVSSLPIASSLIISNVTNSDSFSLVTIPTAGREIHVLVNNNGTSDITITLPTASPYVPINGDHTTVPVGGYAEINAISDGTKIYLRAL